MIIDEQKLKELLKRKKITKSALCEKLGISSRTIAKISKGEEINDNVIMKIITYLDASFDDILEINHILQTLDKERMLKLSGGLYHETQVRLTYNSNHIEGSRLTEDQTRYIFETKTLGNLPSNVTLDDVVETNNHFKCIDYIIQNATMELSEIFITNLQFKLKEGTNFATTYGAGKYKTLPNTVGGIETTRPEDVAKEMKELLKWYNSLKKVTFEDIVEFHYKFECIHPFQDGNGRVGRLIMFKECLKNNIVPFYIDDKYKHEYYNGLKQWKNEKGYLIETCKLGQDMYKMLLDYFKIKYWLLIQNLNFYDITFKRRYTMSLFFSKKSPQDRIRKADNSTQKLRDKRAKLDPRFDQVKINKINSRIHKNNVEIDIAKRELKQPKVEIDNSTKSINFNRNDNSKQFHIHGHYHSYKKK